MPVYEYECMHCQYHLNQIQKISDPVLKLCPQCGQDSLIKLVSAPSFHLKGTGWYATDFKNKGVPSNQSEKKEASTHSADTTTAAAPNTETVTTKKAESKPTSESSD